MEENIKQEIRRITTILVTAICLFGILNTLCLLSRIQELENKIEHVKTFKSE